jgi:hypothetical protein
MSRLRTPRGVLARVGGSDGASGAPEVEPTVRASRVVVSHVLTKHPLGVAVTTTQMRSAAKAASKLWGYLASRSRIRSRNGPRSDRSTERFRAVRHPPSGSGRLVALAIWTHLVASTTKNTYSAQRAQPRRLHGKQVGG